MFARLFLVVAILFHFISINWKSSIDTKEGTNVRKAPTRDWCSISLSSRGGRWQCCHRQRREERDDDCTSEFPGTVLTSLSLLTAITQCVLILL